VRHYSRPSSSPAAGAGRAGPRRAAEHFAFLVLGATLDRAMFEGEQSIPSDAELQRTADDAARAFLVAYGAR